MHAIELAVAVGVELGFDPQVVLDPVLASPTGEVSVYYDGLVLALGHFSAAAPPEFANSSLQSGVWGGDEFENLLRNPSGESRWITMRGDAHPIVKPLVDSLPAYAIPALQDIGGFGRVYLSAASNLFQSFWARFGWNHVSLPVGWYWGLVGLTLLGMVGLVWTAIERWNSIPYTWKIASLWLFLATALLWFGALARTNVPVWNTSLFIPSARYAYPTIIPIALGLTAGWRRILRPVTGEKLGLTLLLVFFVVLDAYSLYTIVRFYAT